MNISVKCQTCLALHFDINLKNDFYLRYLLHIDHGFEVVCSSRVSPAAPRPGGSPGDPLPGDGGGPPEKFIFRRPPPGQISRYSDFGPGPPRPKNPAPGPSRGPPRGPPTRLLETTSKPCSMLCHDHFDQKITTMVRPRTIKLSTRSDQKNVKIKSECKYEYKRQVSDLSRTPLRY